MAEFPPKFCENSAIFRPIRLILIMVTQETIIYRLVVRNHVFDAFFERNYIFDGEMGVAATVAPNFGAAKGTGTSRPEIFGPEPPFKY